MRSPDSSVSRVRVEETVMTAAPRRRTAPCAAPRWCAGPPGTARLRPALRPATSGTPLLLRHHADRLDPRRRVLPVLVFLQVFRHVPGRKEGCGRPDERLHLDARLPVRGHPDLDLEVRGAGADLHVDALEGDREIGR